MATSTLGRTLWVGQAPTARPLESPTVALSGLPQALRRNGALVVMAL